MGIHDTSPVPVHIARAPNPYIVPIQPDWLDQVGGPLMQFCCLRAWTVPDQRKTTDLATSRSKVRLYAGHFRANRTVFTCAELTSSASEHPRRPTRSYA